MAEKGNDKAGSITASCWWLFSSPAPFNFT